MGSLPAWQLAQVTPDWGEEGGEAGPSWGSLEWGLPLPVLDLGSGIGIVGDCVSREAQRPASNVLPTRS